MDERRVSLRELTRLMDVDADGELDRKEVPRLGSQDHPRMIT